MVVAFPNGTSQTYNNIIVERGRASEMNIKYLNISDQHHHPFCLRGGLQEQFSIVVQRADR